jgi:hypothetical protein
MDRIDLAQALVNTVMNLLEQLSLLDVANHIFLPIGRR